jgi:hypothetical protein
VAVSLLGEAGLPGEADWLEKVELINSKTKWEKSPSIIEVL